MGKGKVIKRNISLHKDKNSNWVSWGKKKELFEELRTHVNLRGTLKSFWYSWTNETCILTYVSLLSPEELPTSLPFCCQHPKWCLLSTRQNVSLIQRGSGAWKPCQTEITAPVLPASSSLHLPSGLATQLNWSCPEICTDRPIFEMSICLPGLAGHNHELNDKICGRKSEGWGRTESKEIQGLTGTDRPVT